MAKAGQPAKDKRNRELVRIRDQTGASFDKLGKMFGISKQASWVIYQRGNKKHHNQNLSD